MFCFCSGQFNVSLGLAQSLVLDFLDAGLQMKANTMSLDQTNKSDLVGCLVRDRISPVVII